MGLGWGSTQFNETAARSKVNDCHHRRPEGSPTIIVNFGIFTNVSPLSAKNPQNIEKITNETV